MIYVIIGPTGSGKSDAAHLLSDCLNAPIINADAFQIYIDMNIGTAKIPVTDLHYKKYNLLDIITPDKLFSVKDYQSMFRQCIEDLKKEHKDIIVCGGTGLYIKASLYDYVFEDEKEYDTSCFDSLSNDELYDQLTLIDPKSAANIHPNNRKRVIRALIISKQHDSNKSENIAKQEHKLIYDDVRFMYLDIPRGVLYERINKRVDKMVENGLVEEVKMLKEKYNLSLTSYQAIGYKEIIEYLNGNISLNDAIDTIKQRSRNYAKRQVTFFKNQFKYESFNSPEDIINSVKRYE